MRKGEEVVQKIFLYIPYLILKMNEFRNISAILRILVVNYNYFDLNTECNRWITINKNR